MQIALPSAIKIHQKAGWQYANGHRPAGADVQRIFQVSLIKRAEEGVLEGESFGKISWKNGAWGGRN